jgi:hypothetical protein
MVAQIINMLIGIWLMAAADLFGFDKTVADNDHIIGPFIASFAMIALSPCTHGVRKINIPLGGWLLLAPWVLGYNDTAATVNDMAAGAAVIALSLVRATIRKRFGGGWSAIWKPGSLHEQEAMGRREMDG